MSSIFSSDKEMKRIKYCKSRKKSIETILNIYPNSIDYFNYKIFDYWFLGGYTQFEKYIDLNSKYSVEYFHLYCKLNNYFITQQYSHLIKSNNYTFNQHRFKYDKFKTIQ